MAEDYHKVQCKSFFRKELFFGSARLNLFSASGNEAGFS